MKVGDLVIAGDRLCPGLVVGYACADDEGVGIVVEDCPPADHPNSMHLICVLHEGGTKWWPLSYVRKANESR